MPGEIYETETVYQLNRKQQIGVDNTPIYCVTNTSSSAGGSKKLQLYTNKKFSNNGSVAFPNSTTTNKGE